MPTATWEDDMVAGGRDPHLSKAGTGRGADGGRHGRRSGRPSWVVAVARRHDQYGPPRIGMGFHPVELHPPGFRKAWSMSTRRARRWPGLALSWKPVGDPRLGVHPPPRRHVSQTARPSTPTRLLFNLDRMFRKNLDRWGIKDVTPRAPPSRRCIRPWRAGEKTGDYTVRIYTSEPRAEPLGLPSDVSRWCRGSTPSRTASRGSTSGRWAPASLEDGRLESAVTRCVSRRYEGYWGPPPLFKAAALSRSFPKRGSRVFGRSLRAGPGHPRRCVCRPSMPVCSVERPGLKVSSSVQKIFCRIYLNARARRTSSTRAAGTGLFTDPRVRLALKPRRQQGRHRPEDLPRAMRRPMLRPVSHRLLWLCRPRSPYAYGT